MWEHWTQVCVFLFNGPKLPKVTSGMANIITDVRAGRYLVIGFNKSLFDKLYLFIY